MSIITLKNHTSPEGTPNNKVSPNTVLAPLFLEKAVSLVGGQLVEINFKAADKINITYQFTEGQDISTAFANAVDQYNTIIANKQIVSILTSQRLLDHTIIKGQSVDTTETALNLMQFIKVNKSSVKGNTSFEAEIAYKKVLATPAASKSITAPAATTTAAALAQSTQQPAQAQQKQQNTAQIHASMIADHVFASLFDTAKQFDFNAFQNIFKLKQELSHLEHRLSLAKNKDKQAIQACIDEVNSQIQPHYEAYQAFHKSIQTSVAQDVVVVTNHGYTKGLASVRSFSDRK